MTSFGSKLRQERAARGVQLEDISAATRVAMRYLHSLEEDDFQALPGGVFNKGIVRGYARYLEMDEHTTVSAFVDACRSKGIALYEEVEWSEFAENVSNQRGGKRKGRFLRWAGVILLLAVVGGLGFLLWWWISHYKIVTR
jgi:cytoskeletal protein RodZ